ncbi:MAG TPA: ABC transporter permease subunit [Opitutaceae bacterium]
MKHPLLEKLLPALTAMVVIALWYLVGFGLSEDQKFLLPAPHEIVRALIEKGPELWQATVNTAVGALAGFGLAIASSFVLALILSLSPAIRASLYPCLMVLQMTPIIILAPILILIPWIGPGFRSVTSITFLICFFPMVVNTTQGLISTDRNLVDYFRMCKAGRHQEIFLLRVPAALPFFFTGLRIAGTLAPIGAIVGDFYAGNSAGGGGGLGFLTIIYSSQFQMAALFATALVSCALGFIFVGSVLVVSWASLHRWHDSFSKSDV